MNNTTKIGTKIKDLRIQKGLTQEELADRCELSKGFISQLERDLTSPSIATLLDILTCLGTDLKDFFNDSEDNQIAFKEADYFEKIDEELHNKIEWIIPNAQKNMMEPIRLSLSPGGSTYPDNPHEGEEFGLCAARKHHPCFRETQNQGQKRGILLFQGRFHPLYTGRSENRCCSHLGQHTAQLLTDRKGAYHEQSIN